ncbi:iron-sulfur cluster assembly protein, partial [Escherichia coli]|nr:iron-sulfur cluster assembly protein [Escherichia coli]
MLTEQQVKDAVGEIVDPFLNRSLNETDAIKEISIKEEKKHISVKVAVAKTGTSEQLSLQSTIVEKLKEIGAATVGIRFIEFTP